MKMGTRGAYGFYKNGVTKVTYNHFDSYPSGLGKEVLKFIKETSIEKMNEIFDSIILVDEDEAPTSEQVKEVTEVLKLGEEFYDTSKRQIDWYSLLRPVQGDLTAYAKGLRYMIDNAEFLKNSLFCEWAYIINLDDNTFEIYRGLQKKPQKNRYYTEEDISGYYNVALVAKIPIRTIKNLENIKASKKYKILS